MPDPGPLTEPIETPDVQIFSQKTLDRATVARIRNLDGVANLEQFSMGSFFREQRQITYAAVNPGSFRKFTPVATAQTDAVWQRVAGGEIAVRPNIGRAIQDRQGYLRIGNAAKAPRVHVGAYADLIPPTFNPQLDAVVNQKWGKALHMPRGNALFVSTGDRSPQRLMKKFRQIADQNGTRASVQILGPKLDFGVLQTAVLSGGSVAGAVGSFSYRANPDGTVVPDPAWVAANIRTEVMPIIGPVTGHKVMLPQLRAALLEVQATGLASKIYQFGGCYVPRFIANDPSKGLSFHTFGTAIDLNVQDNPRGSVGKMDPGVVAIFKRWGFAWGGDWNYTDPMHFELATLKHPG